MRPGRSYPQTLLRERSASPRWARLAARTFRSLRTPPPGQLIPRQRADHVQQQTSGTTATPGGGESLTSKPTRTPSSMSVAWSSARPSSTRPRTPESVWIALQVEAPRTVTLDEDHHAPRAVAPVADLGPGRRDGPARAARIDTGLRVYFCDPQSPWQRGTNENTNGLLRQYFPSGTDLTRHSADDLAAVAAALNTRARKTLGWRTPAEVLDEYVTMAA